MRAMRLVLASVILLPACTSSDDNRENVGGSGVPAWESGERDDHFGPFPRSTRSITAPGVETADGWFTVIVPGPDPVASFDGLIADAEAAGFETAAAEDDTCWQVWSREEVPLGNDEEFGGTASFDDELPQFARITGIGCAALGARSDERILITLDVSSVDSEKVPTRPVLAITSTDREPGEVEVDTSGVPTLPTVNRVPVTPIERRPAQLDWAGTLEPAYAALVTILPDQDEFTACLALLLRSDEDPLTAANRTIDGSGRAAILEAPEAAPVDVGTGDAAWFSKNIPAGGGNFVVTAGATETGSDVLVCEVSGG